MSAAGRGPAAATMLELENESWRVGVLPSTGGSLAFGRVAIGGRWAELLRPTPADALDTPEATASFPLIPWSNRVRDGVLRYRGGAHRLLVNAGDGTAIHGIARNRPWVVTSASASEIVLDFDARVGGGAGPDGEPLPFFPWSFTARIVYRLEGPSLIVETTLGNADESTFPAGIGHHPYFRRGLGAADGAEADEVLLELPASRSYALSAALPERAAEPVEPRIDFRRLRRLGDAFIDDLLTGRAAAAPIRLVYPESGIEVQLHADEGYRHMVLYVPQAGRDFFAVEPVTNANDGFSLADRGVPGHGVFELAPGESRTLRWSLTLRSISG